MTEAPANPNKALWEKGDFTRIADNSFDLVMSIFGAMFAPKPVDVARRLPISK